MMQSDTFQRAFANNWNASKILWRLHHDLDSLTHRYSHCIFKYVALSEDLYNKAGGPSAIRSIGNEMVDVKIAFHLHGLEYCIFFEYNDSEIRAVNADPKKVWLTSAPTFDVDWISKALREKIDSAVERAKYNDRCDAFRYCMSDALATQEIYKLITEDNKMGPKLRIKKVVFNDPATIIFWYDGTKTVVKTHGKEKFDPEKGLAMAISKKVLGTNKSGSNYYDVFENWISAFTERKIKNDNS